VRFAAFLAEGLTAAGRTQAALEVVDSAIRQSEAKEELWCIAELLRLKGEILLAEGAEARAVEPYFVKSIEWARQQDALSWELRVTMSLARLTSKAGQLNLARRSLVSVYNRFSEGFETADLIAARSLLQTLPLPL